MGENTRGRVYIAGPMTGLPDWNFQAFFDAERQLAKIGYNVQNPARNDGAEWLDEAIDMANEAIGRGKTWQDYMREAIAQLVTCDYIYKLPGWERSSGAVTESNLATSLGIVDITGESL